MKLWTRAGVAWLAILVLAVLNGAAREALLAPALGRTAALVASGLLLSALILLVAFAAIGRLRPVTARAAWQVGALWLALTLLFEFGFGALVQHKSWAELLQAYTFRDGNIWPLVLLVTVLAPVLAWRLRPRLAR
jgi:hypothetical protein